MKDTQLYTQILGIEKPWQVSDVKVSLSNDEVEITVNHGSDPLTCPKCGKRSPGYDKRTRRWRHLDTCQLKTLLVAEVPRVNCAEHGVVTIAVPWSESGSGFTALFEALVIDWLKEASVSAVSTRMGLSWNAVDGIMQRAVTRGMARREHHAPTRLGVDETSFQKRHEYVTVVTDHSEQGRVLHVADDRKAASLTCYLETLTDAERAAIECINMDMWPAYIKAAHDALPQAESCIAFDKFHVAKYLGGAVDKVRRQEHRRLLANGDELLKGSKYSWLRNPQNMSREQWREFAVLRASGLKTARAWAIKELAMSLWHYSTRGWAMKAWKRWLSWAFRSRLGPVRKVARMIRAHLWGIVNAIILKSDNGRSEAMNRKIQQIKRRACGYRNRERFRNAIYFHLGGLDLYPKGVA